jgi:serine/threonine-protein kinase RsbW
MGDLVVEMFRQARMENLPALMAAVEAACRERCATADTTFDLKLAVEEVFTNIVRHGYPAGPGPVSLSIASEPDSLAVTLRDEAVPFDPAMAPLPDLESDWQTRPLGGLGWHLVRRLVDEVRHRPAPGGGNVITLIKRIPGGDR